MPELKNEEGAKATVSVSPGLKRQRIAKDGIMSGRSWCNRFPVLMKDAKGYIHRVPYSRWESWERDGKAKLMDPSDPVLIQNYLEAYFFVRAEIAEEMERMNKAVIMQGNDPAYLRAVHIAMGLDPDGKFKKGEGIQRHGEIVGVEDIGRFDVESVLAEAKAMVAGLKADDKTGLVTEDLPDPDSFAGRKRAQRMR